MEASHKIDYQLEASPRIDYQLEASQRIDLSTECMTVVKKLFTIVKIVYNSRGRVVCELLNSRDFWHELYITVHLVLLHRTCLLSKFFHFR